MLDFFPKCSPVCCILYFIRYLVLSQPVTDKIGQKLNVLTLPRVLIHYCVSAKPGHVISFSRYVEMKMLFFADLIFFTNNVMVKVNFPCTPTLSVFFRLSFSFKSEVFNVAEPFVVFCDHIEC